jgi:hypothetical protein
VSIVRPKFKEKETQEQQESNGNEDASYDFLLFDKKVALASEGLEPFFDKILRQKTSKENALMYKILYEKLYSILGSIS